MASGPSDMRLKHFTWLFQVSHLARMLDNQTPPTTASPKFPALHRTRLLMLRILQLQVKEQPLHPSMRTGSLHTWWNDRLRHHYHYHPAITFDPNRDDPREEGELHTSRETFPEGADFSDRSLIDDKMRRLRAGCMTVMKIDPYDYQDKGYGAEKALRLLWGRFKFGMEHNPYLRTAHHEKGVLIEWESFDEREEYEFLKSFTFAEKVSDCSPVLATECAFLVRSTATLDKPYSEFVAEQCYKEYCAPKNCWFNLLPVPTIPEVDDCPICLDPYENKLTGTWSSRPIKEYLWRSDQHTPVMLSCDHYICLPCFKRWTASTSDMENRDKCPMCRRGLPPPNPALAWHQEFTEELQHVSNDQTLTEEEYAKRLKMITHGYVAKLPMSLLTVTRPTHPLNVATATDPADPKNLVRWCAYFLEPAAIASHVRHYHQLEQTCRSNGGSSHPLEGGKNHLQLVADRLGLICALLAHNRLVAASHKLETWRKVLKKELCARAELENMLFAAEMHEFCAAYEDKIEEVQEDAVGIDRDDEADDDEDSGDSTEGESQSHEDFANLIDSQGDVWSETSDNSEEDEEAAYPGDESYTADMEMLNLELLYD